ncbi:PRC-barrel domain-containing protein [Pseudosulfitobacter koreensis]|uniref:PRC-barrel domain-containing protein n=1 Tax=Pseudosulfitobacter koreensis TaxID=2968472 RepID=A0ABT1YVR2_9RHOB|nr:PRC-barrel domain-containing protein [Pseudosulfitobacter koreense]MCR8824973.1 PRC-barrel domain-containing protein [Pseudosulfitobacter koreense]
MKHFLATTAAAALMATTVYAQTEMQSPFVDSTAENVASAQTVRASNLIGKSVYVTQAEVDGLEVDTDAIEWERVGEVNDLIMSPDGEVNAVLLDIGGFLGIGERSVALSVDQVKLVSGMNDGGEYYVVFNGTPETLENAPEYDSTMIGTWAEDSDANAGATEGAAVDPAMTDTDMSADADAQTGDTAMTETATADTELQTDDTTMADTDATMDTDANADMTADTDMNADADAQATDPAMADTDTATTEEMSTDTQVITTDNEASTSEGNQDGLYAATPPNVAVEGWSQVQFEDLTTDDLTGAVVMDANMEDIGEVAELYMSDDGQLTGARLDIGGFLGIGEDHVRVDMQSLNIQREGDAGQFRVYVDMTEESLKAMQEAK